MNTYLRGDESLNKELGFGIFTRQQHFLDICRYFCDSFCIPSCYTPYSMSLSIFAAETSTPSSDC